MRFVFHVRYPASFFTVVDNLSLWSLYCHEQYRRHWIEKYGLTDGQKSLLIRYSKIRKNYPWRKMEPIFMYADTMKDAWDKAKSVLDNGEVRTLKKVFRTFRETFDKEWKQHGYLLHRRKAFEEIFQQCNIEQAIDEVKHFYDWKEVPPEIDVRLLYNPSLHWGGGGGHAGVQLEVRQDERRETIIKDFAVLLHEAFHVLEFRNGIRDKLREMGAEWRSKVLPTEEGDVCSLVTEAVMDTLVPDGILTQKFLGIHEDALKKKRLQDDYWQKRLREAKNEKDRRKALMRVLRRELTSLLLAETKVYLEEKKTVWDSYWSKALYLFFETKASIQST